MGEVLSYTKAGIEALIADVIENAGLSEAEVQALVDASVAALVDSSPATLDTLNELAAALGDDENFAATIAGQISGLDTRLDVLEATPSSGPSVVGTATVNGAGSTRTDWSMTPHADTAIGDLLVFISNIGNFTMAVPEGWSAGPAEVSGGYPDVRVFTKTATAADLGVSHPFTSSGSSYGSAHLVSLRDLNTLVASAQSAANTGASGVVTAPTVTSPSANALIMRVFAAESGTAAGFTPVGDVVELVDAASIAGLMLSVTTQEDPGATGTAQANSDYAQSGRGASSMTLVFDFVAASKEEQSRIEANNEVDSYQLVLSDAGKVIELNKATALNLTVPTDATVAFPIGTVIELWQQGAGQVTVVAAGGVTIRSTEGKLKLYGQYVSASLRKRAANEWVLTGDLVA